MLLTGHSQESNLRRALPLIQETHPAYWVALDPPPDAAAAAAAAGTRLIVRRFWRYDFNPGAVQADMGRPPAEAAAEFVASARAQGWYQHAWGVMTPPAMATASSQPDLLAWAVQFMATCVQQFGADGRACLVANVPTGNDGFLVPGARYYACQEYGWPCVDSQASTPGGPFHAYRYRHWFPPIRSQQPDAELAVLECGSTALLPAPHPVDASAPHGSDVGWRGGFGIAGVDPEEYWEGLLRYNQQAEADRYVLCLAVYQVGANDDWATFEHLGTEMEARLRQALLTGAAAPGQGQGAVTGPVELPQPEPAPQPEPMPPAHSGRTPDQQNVIDVVNGWANAFAQDAARLAALAEAAPAGDARQELADMALRQADGARQLHDVVAALESEFPAS